MLHSPARCHILGMVAQRLGHILIGRTKPYGVTIGRQNRLAVPAERWLWPYSRHGNLSVVVIISMFYVLGNHGLPNKLDLLEKSVTICV